MKYMQLQEDNSENPQKNTTFYEHSLEMHPKKTIFATSTRKDYIFYEWVLW